MPKLKNKIKIANRIRAKSLEAFLLCLEIYNKPTIHYRIEASAFFICNAWELLLKAYHISINGEKSIYRPNSTYSFSLEEMLNKYFEDNSPVKKNLKYIIEKIRDKSTHLIIPEHDYIYTPFLQKAVLNYSQFINEKFNVNVADIVPFEYLALISKKEYKPKAIAKLYSKSYSDLFNEDYRDVIQTMNDTESEQESIFAQINYTISFVKDSAKADIKAYYTKNDAIPLKTVTIAKNPNVSHPFTMKQVIAQIKERIVEEKMPYPIVKLNNARLLDFNKEHNVANHPEFITVLNYGSQNMKKYSQAYIDYIFAQLEKNPHIFAEKK